MRFADDGRWLHSFAGEFAVRCPRCSSRARVHRGWDPSARRWLPASVVCGGCGYSRSESRRPVWFGPVMVSAHQPCGNCGRRLWTRRRVSARPRFRLLDVSCAGCGATTRVPFRVTGLTVPDALVDSCFGLPLWLRAPCAGHTLWAFNEAHLAYLKAYLESDLPQRSGSAGATLIERLPRWLKTARPEALRAIRRLESSGS